MHWLGPPTATSSWWGRRTGAAEAVRIAREIQSNLGIEPLERPFSPETERLIDPEECERQLRGMMPAWQQFLTSDDYTEYCWHCPTVRLFVARPVLAGPAGFVYPAWVANALGGIRATIEPMIRWRRRPSEQRCSICSRNRAARSCKARIRGADRRRHRRRSLAAPLLAADFKVPHQYRWPEYVTTAQRRGVDDSMAGRRMRASSNRAFVQ